ncbi:MAG: methyltransferase RsmF C-terminal domain-like protein [Chitinophagaceae bacterium]
MDLSLPQELLKSLDRVRDFDVEQFLAAHERPATVSLRYNPHKFLESIQNGAIWPLHASPVPWSAYGYYLKERPVFTLDPAFHAGAYYVQEASSMFIEHVWKQLMMDQDGLRVLDLCAAPGGKTTLLSSMPGIKLLLANEIIKSRVSILYENVVKWGDPKILVSNNDPAEVGQLHEFFDVMLVDAPCSGSGLFRKDNSAISEWSAEAVKHCSERQKRILADSLPALKENGILIYSTCSFSSEENEDIMDWLISKNEMESISIDIPSKWGIQEVESSISGIGYRFMPHKVEGEGFFVACFRKKYHTGELSLRERKSIFLVQREKLMMEHWLKDVAMMECMKTKDDQVICVPLDIVKEQMQLSENLNLRKSGLHAGALIRDQYLPGHELSQSLWVHDETPQISLDGSEALEFLRKMTIRIPVMDKGWYLVHHEGYHLGWIKHLGNRVNNYYPASWRILMS